MPHRGRHRPGLTLEHHLVPTGGQAAAQVRLVAVPGLDAHAPAVVLLHGFAQNHRTFDAPGRSLANHLARLRVRVALMDLRGRLGVPASGARSLWHYTEEDLSGVVRWLRHRFPRAPLAVVGHSMGGLVAAALPHAAAEELSALVLLASPLLLLEGWGPLRAPLVSALRVAEPLVRLPLPTGLAGWALDLARPTLDASAGLPPLAVWAPRSMEPGLLRWALRRSFEHEAGPVLADMLELGLTEGERAGRLTVMRRLQDLRVPLLIMSGRADGLAPPASVEPLHRHAGSADKTYVELGGRSSGGPAFGHVDLLMGQQAPRHVWARLVSFLGSRLPGAAEARGLGLHVANPLD